MIYQFLLFCVLIFNFHLCQGDETESQIKGPKYAIIRPTGNDGFEHPSFPESVFEKRLTNGKWRYQSLLEDNSTGYCGYCKNEYSKQLQIDKYFVKSILKGGDKLMYVTTRKDGYRSQDPVSVSMTPVPGKVKLNLTDPLTSHYSGIYSITRQLYNGFQQYQKTEHGPRMYVNIYNQWVIGTWDHTDKIIMNQIEASPNFTNTWSGWSKSLEHVKDDDSILTLKTANELPKSSGQPPECIIQFFKYNFQDDLFKLTTNGTYMLADLPIEERWDWDRFYAHQSDGLWEQTLVNDFDWIKAMGPHLRTSESSAVIPRRGWATRDIELRYEPGYDSFVIGTPCTIELRFNYLSEYEGAYAIENKLENGHPVYTKDDNKFSLYVNSSKKWVLGRIVENQAGAQKKEDVFILSQDFTITPLTWPEWFNSGTQQNPVLTPRQV